MNARLKPIFGAAIILLVAWALALGGFKIARNSRVTVEKVVAFLQSFHLNKLDSEARRKLLHELALKLNKLTPEERRKVRYSDAWKELFAEMTESEKGTLLDETLPSGFKQMIASFEEMSADKRSKAISDAVRRLQKSRQEMQQEDPELARNAGTNGPPLSEELQKKVVETGLKTFYGESSARTKAELAPLLEEMNRMMETGGLFRPGRRRDDLPMPK